MKSSINTFNYFIFLLIFLITVKSEVYIVGDKAEEWSTGVNYLTWSQRYKFYVGDILVFNYIKGQQNTYEVTEATYKSCNSSSGVLAKYASGSDRITLNEAKKYWFICDIPGHCFGGMRFGIDVNNAVIFDAPPPILDQNSSSATMKMTTCVVFLFLLLI